MGTTTKDKGPCMGSDEDQPNWGAIPHVMLRFQSNVLSMTNTRYSIYVYLWVPAPAAFIRKA